MELVAEIEEAWEDPFVVETDKAWDTIHRCLTDGSLLYISGEYPLNHCICGGRQLIRGRDYTVTFVSAPQVKDVAAALAKITRAWTRKRYDQIDPEEYDEVEMGDEDFGYTWENFRTCAGSSRRPRKRAGQSSSRWIDCWRRCGPGLTTFPCRQRARTQAPVDIPNRSMYSGTSVRIR
jgi:hypothetical protein